MKLFVITAGALALLTVPALADEPVSDSEAASIQAALQEWGCEGGEMEREREDPVVYEVEDANCRGTDYDFRLDSDFNVTLISRH